MAVAATWAERAIVLIPARMASTRLPGKPLAVIAGEPMIVQVWRRAREAGFANVAVACAEREIAAAIEAAGGAAVLTDPAHPSGSDRIWEALGHLDPDGRFDLIINLQGDLPTIAPDAIAAAGRVVAEGADDIGTLAAPIQEGDADRANPNVTKAIIAWEEGEKRGRALYFTRASAPAGPGPLWHHVGIYAYRRAALSRFVALPPSPLEKRERLEQLRALEAGMTIGIARIEGVPLGVDTPEDLEKARAILESTAGKGSDR
ncbi:MAG: 3-deoxy-manno-octulosonate cytidylyltransferase [Alphaproteobacteria bacterium]|nr:3-deoxy-manno-octulosonate cytidylyltransferase [Alphaproteobacteria bacterium]